MEIYCRRCKRETSHKPLKEKKFFNENEKTDIWEDSTYQIVQCEDCRTISFREVIFCSEEIDTKTGQPQEMINIYPKSSIDDIELKTYFYVPIKLKRLYKEVIDSFNNDNFILCAAGLRAIIEGICDEKGVTKGKIKEGIKKTKTLQGKIAGLHEKGLLSVKHSDVLQKHRLIGNKALHELEIPSRKSLKIAIDIIEHTLENTYELDGKVEELEWEMKRSKKQA